MVRTQIYLTEAEHESLQALSRQTGKSKSALMRDAFDRMVGEFDEDARRANLMAACGIWKDRKDRKDRPDARKLRASWDRRRKRHGR